MTGYRRMSKKEASDFRKSNSEYNAYDCDIRCSSLIRDCSEDDKSLSRECSYLINTRKYIVSLSELYSGKYDVIFVSPDWDTDK